MNHTLCGKCVLTSNFPLRILTVLNMNDDAFHKLKYIMKCDIMMSFEDQSIVFHMRCKSFLIPNCEKSRIIITGISSNNQQI